MQGSLIEVHVLYTIQELPFMYNLSSILF